MEIVARGPLEVSSVLWQPSAAAWAQTIVCKATFALEPVESPLAPEQEPICEADQSWSDGPSLRAASDLAPRKAGPEVVLVGHAHAPELPAHSVLVRLAVGAVDKRIEVFCDRILRPDGEVVLGPPFSRMPIRYERAAGGLGTKNPVGMSFEAAPDRHGNVPLPNLQPPGLHVTHRRARFAPIGFGPIAPTWPERTDTMKVFKSPSAAVDPAYFNVAPLDQRLGVLRADERIVLENLLPGRRQLVTALPGVEPRAAVMRRGRAPEALRLVADTLWIDADRALCTLVWRAAIALTHPSERGQVVVSMVSPTREPADRTESYPKTAPLKPALPFVAGPASPTMGSPSLTPSAPPPPRAFDEDTTRVHVRPPELTLDGALPFARASQAPPPLPALVPSPLAPPPPLASTEPLPLAPAPASASIEPAPEPEPPASSLPLAAYPIERCGAIAASLACAADRAAVLADRGLDAETWEALDEHWRGVLRAQTRRGKDEALRARDAGFVAQLEEERGPIVAGDYARLLVAQERGEAEEELARRDLPPSALMPVLRVWMRRAANDAAVGAEVRASVAAAREA